jgi:hypothetical protein
MDIELRNQSTTVSRVVDALWSVLAVGLWAVVMAMGMYAFIMPDPAEEERGRELYDAMMQQLTEEQVQCEAQMLHDVRVRRRPTQADVDEAHAACDRTSAWR